MPTFTDREVRSKATARGFDALNARRSLQKSFSDFSEYREYDIFLSHSSKDAQLILGVKLAPEQLGHSVYVDWIDDPHLDRENVCTETAQTLRKRMCACRSLFYVTTENAQTSRWMPWECGYFDGNKDKVAILPITREAARTYHGQEYLGLYPYTTKEIFSKGTEHLVVWRTANECEIYRMWVEVNPSDVRWKQCR
jgi:hypothetical protein